jgi:hypothetical protein
MSEAEVALLQAQVEDARASLAAALARIEGFRIRERQLASELAQLRQQVGQRGAWGTRTGPRHQRPAQACKCSCMHTGKRRPCTPQAIVAADTQYVAPRQVHGPGTQGADKDAPVRLASGPKLAAAQAPPPAAGASSQAPAAVASTSGSAPASAFTSPSGQPVYVTNLEGEYPVHIVSGARKVRTLAADVSSAQGRNAYSTATCATAGAGEPGCDAQLRRLC